jgi:predicted amidohydrolase
MRFHRCFGLMLVAVLASCAAPGSEDSAQKPASVRVAVCQIAPGISLEESLMTIEQALSAAAAEGAQIACFPETTLFGWVNPNAHQLADPIPGATTDLLATLAQRHQIMIAIGLAERDGQQLYDSAILLDSDGTLLLHHRKVNILTHLMDPPYTPGKSASSSIADTRFGRIGMLVCADTFLDETVAEVAAGQPDWMLVPYGWAAPQADWPKHGESLQAWVSHTARRTGAPVVGVDATGMINHGPWTGYQYGGQSVVSNADGKVLAVLADRKSETRVIEVEL